MSVNTFSIVARDPENGDLGIAVASKFLAVGAVVPWAEAATGAVATQSWANTAFGPNGLALMRDGATAAEALGRLLAEDDGREHRQVGLVDAGGGAAAHTGAECSDWAGHRIGDGYTCQGNILAGSEVLESMATALERATGALSVRLLEALAAGDAAGGDRRGKQAAALLVVREGGGYLGLGESLVDLRVDDHAAPIDELRRLLALNELFRGTSPVSDKLPIDAALLRELQALLAAQGYYAGEPSGEWDDATRVAMAAFIGAENLEERTDLEKRTIDAPALAYVRERFAP